MIPSTDEVWEIFHRRLYRFIYNRVEDPQDAEDLLQEVFLRVHTRLEDLRDQERLAPWLYQIARNAVSDYYRRKRTTVELTEQFPAAVEQTAPDPAAEIASGLEEMIASLPDPYRETVMLSEIQGLNHKDIAARLGLSLSGVKSRVQRGRELLRRDLWECCHFEFDRRGHLIYYEPRPECCPLCSD
jgi:RNA polymerase sigma-70 factor, ECF subfamily